MEFKCTTATMSGHVSDETKAYSQDMEKYVYNIKKGCLHQRSSHGSYKFYNGTINILIYIRFFANVKMATTVDAEMKQHAIQI